MPKPGELLKEKEVQKPEFQFREVQDDWLLVDNNDEMEQVQQQQQLQNQPLEGAVYAQPERIHANVAALNDYIRTRENKEWVSTYDSYKKLADTLTLKASQQNMQTKESNWKNLEEEARVALEEVTAMDNEQMNIRQNATFPALDQEIDALLLDKNRITDSPTYKRVRRAAKAYKNEKNFGKKMGYLTQLKTNMEDYASLRFKRSYGTTKGERRMTRVARMLTMTNRLLEAGKFIEMSAKESEAVSALTKDVEQYHGEDVREIQATHRFDNITALARWAQAMMPYERDKNGNVTPETAANYAENVELLEAFKTDDAKRQKVVLYKIYQRMDLRDYDEDTFTIEGIIKEGESMFSGKGYHTNKNILMDLLEYFKNDDDPVMKYIIARIVDSSRSSMGTAVKFYMLSLGYDYQTVSQIDQSQTEMNKVITNDFLEDARRIFKGQLSTDSPEYQYMARNEEMEKAIQSYIDNNASPDSTAYLQKTNDLVQEVLKQQSEVDESFKINHPEEYNSGKYWTQHTRQGNLLLNLERDEKGELTANGQKNHAYNEKMIKLLNSDDQTDRIAALASCFLKCYWGGLTEDQLTDKGFSMHLRKMIQTEGFFSKYNSIEDFVKDEFARDTSNELLIYMRSIIYSSSRKQANVIAPMFFHSHGYEADVIGGKVDPRQQKASHDAMEAYIDIAKAELQEERAKNNGKLITVDPAMNAKLEKLCREKGLM